MKKIFVSVLALILIIGIIISINLFVKNQQIQEELSKVSDSEFVQDGDSQSSAEATSEIIIERKDGEWMASETSKYAVDTNSLSLTFTGYKIGGEHTGTFEDLNGVLGLNDQGDPVSLTLSVSPSSVKTDTEAVDKHLQDAVFFDTAQYSDMSIKVKNFENRTETSATAITDITIKGITKTLKVPVTFVKTESSTTFALDTKIKISEWDMAFGPVLDDVRVMLEGTVVKK